MGGGSSAPPPPPPTLYDQPWRQSSAKYTENLDFVRSYKPQNRQLKQLRILLHGPIGTGKSSFINSVDSVLKSRPASRALSDAISGSSFTRKYETFKLYKGNKEYSFVFNDIMGFEASCDSGISVEDIALAMQGHVQEGYRFQPDDPLQEGDAGYRADPTLEDKVHVLVSVVSAESLSILDRRIVSKMREVRLAASDLGIPQLVILTKVDLACKETEQDPSNIYRSMYLKKQVDDFHHMLGVPMNCIFLVKNYNEELELNEHMSAAILCAMRQMLCFGDDHLQGL